MNNFYFKKPLETAKKKYLVIYMSTLWGSSVPSNVIQRYWYKKANFVELYAAQDRSFW